MTIDEAITDCESVMFGAELMKQSEVYKYNQQIAEWLKELKAYRNIMIYLFTNVVDGGYLLHKWTHEFGYVIQVTDVISAFDEVKDIQNANAEREGITNERKTEGKEV